MRPVSSDADELILVDEEDRVLGHETKARCHDGEGLLHRAFSIFIFNSRGELLLQQRAAGKRLWPGFWSNSCCSHPRRGEEMNSAASRRLEEELGLTTRLAYIYKFVYHARFGHLGSERELCSVFWGKTDDPPRVHPEEVSAWRFVSPAVLEDELQSAPASFTPWFLLEWPEVRLARNTRITSP